MNEVEALIENIGGWRGEVLRRIRTVIKRAGHEIIEEIKWRKPSSPSGVPVWSDNGMICTAETYQDKVKMTFANGASLDDPSKLFNASLGGGTRRAIDLREGDAIDEAALQALIREAIAFNRAKASR